MNSKMEGTEEGVGSLDNRTMQIAQILAEKQTKENINTFHVMKPTSSFLSV